MHLCFSLCYGTLPNIFLWFDIILRAEALSVPRPLFHLLLCLLILLVKTWSVVAGFGRHGMPPPASNDTGTAFCFPKRGRDETYRWCELMILTFDFGGHSDFRSYASWYFVRLCDLVTLTFNLEGLGACCWCRSMSSIRTPILKFLDLTI